MKRVQLISLLFFIFFVSTANAITFIESGGWFESAFVKWEPVENAESYRVYYSGEGISNRKIDDQLIRKYENYFRADVLGLKAGKYTIKVVPVISDTEYEAGISDEIEVKAHDRSGFAFMNGRIPGAYKADGTPKDNAIVLYVTENNKNKISLDVTGANENPCIGLETILEGFKKGNDARPLIVRLVGQITDFDYMDKGDIVIENDNNTNSYITLEGVGDDAVADGWGIRVKNASNIEIRNIGVMNCDSDEGDDIGLQQNNEYVWVHHCDLFYGNAGSDSDQAKGDGAMDCKKSTYVTFSYNHFWDSGKCNLLGLSEDTTIGLYVSYHHNWYDHSDSRHPRVRYYSAHVYNNYYDGNAKYGVGATLGSSVFVEANYFRNCKYPILTSMQGSDVYDESTNSNDYSDMPTFSKEDGGTVKAYNNYMTGQRRFVSYGATEYPNSTIDFDAYLANSSDETLSNSVVSAYGKNSYNNFDTNSATMYTYSAESPVNARITVMQQAGRTNGGDFKWVFNNAVDDVSYAVNSELKAALVAYKTSLIEIQGDSINGGDNPDDPGEFTDDDLIHNFTTLGTSSPFYQIVGNLSDSKGTVEYGGYTLTQCLKIESGTSISFTISGEATLTLVFNNNFNGDIKINGVSYTAISGILTLTIPAGTYEITKDDSANLFFMSVVLNGNGLQNIESTNIHIYPNPVTNYLYVSANVDVDFVELYNLNGVLIKRSSIYAHTIDMGDLEKGHYIIRVLTFKECYQRLVLKK